MNRTKLIEKIYDEIDKLYQNFKEKGVVFFDVANECYRIDTEQYQRIIDINSYSNRSFKTE